MPKSKRVVYKIPGSKPPYIRTTKNSNKEFEDIRCPICMEYPHNAVLLVCSSHDKGCRPYMCNAPIQSPCLTKYRAMSATKDLSCPLCRGHVATEERAIGRVRQFMDSKARECKLDTCEFSGTSKELMGHWWDRHRNNDVAQSEEELRRRREWARLESECELQEIEASVETRIVIVHATSATATSASAMSESATSLAGVGGDPGPQRIRRGARMSVAGQFVGRRLASPAIPPGCLSMLRESASYGL